MCRSLFLSILRFWKNTGSVAWRCPEAAVRNLLATPFPRRPAPIRARARLLATGAPVAVVALIAAPCLFGNDVWAQPAPAEKPTNLTASLVADGIQLNWEAPEARPAEISGYQILRRRPDGLLPRGAGVPQSRIPQQLRTRRAGRRSTDREARAHPDHSACCAQSQLNRVRESGGDHDAADSDQRIDRCTIRVDRPAAG